MEILNKVNLSKKKTIAIIVLLILVIALPLMVFTLQKQQEIRQRAAGIEATLSMTKSGSTTPITNIAIVKGSQTTLDLRLNAGTNILNGYDIVINFNPSSGTGALTINNLTEGADAKKFNVPLFSKVDLTTNTIRIAKVNNGESTSITGNLHLASITFTGNSVGSGNITIIKADVTSPSQAGSLVAVNIPFVVNYNVISNPTPTPGCFINGTNCTSNNQCCSGYCSAGKCAVNPTITPTKKLSPTPTFTPTPTPPPGCYYEQVQCIQAPCNPVLVCPSLTPTLTPVPGSTGYTLNLSLHLQGIGLISGENPGPVAGQYPGPQHTTRKVLVDIFKSDGTVKKQIGSKTGSIFYGSGGSFKGSVDLGQLSSGIYSFKITSSKYLRKTVLDSYEITTLVTKISIPEKDLIIGDVNDDNVIDLKDYNAYLSCVGKPVSKCNADLNDDGLNDQEADPTTGTQDRLPDKRLLMQSYQTHLGD